MRYEREANAAVRNRHDRLRREKDTEVALFARFKRSIRTRQKARRVRKSPAERILRGVIAAFPLRYLSALK